MLQSTVLLLCVVHVYTRIVVKIDGILLLRSNNIILSINKINLWLITYVSHNCKIIFREVTIIFFQRETRFISKLNIICRLLYILQHDISKC